MANTSSEHWALWDELKRRLSELLDAMPELPSSERDFVCELLDHDEFGLAFQLLDEAARGLALTGARDHELGALAALMGLFRVA